MDIRDRIVTIYLGRPNQVNLPSKFAKQLLDRSWKNKEEVFAYHDKKTDRIIITRNYDEIKKRYADGRICTFFDIPPQIGGFQ